MVFGRELLFLLIGIPMPCKMAFFCPKIVNYVKVLQIVDFTNVTILIVLHSGLEMGLNFLKSNARNL